MSCARRVQEWLEITMQTNKQQKAMKKMEKRTENRKIIKNKKRIQSKTKRSEVMQFLENRKPSLKDREQEDKKGLEFHTACATCVRDSVGNPSNCKPPALPNRARQGPKQGISSSGSSWLYPVALQDAAFRAVKQNSKRSGHFWPQKS